MHINAGIHKGRKLATLPGRDTRPTAGKVREAIFSILDELVVDANVLDLFAGTGSFGLEAISRGAQNAVFVENDRRNIDVLRKNIAACREDERTVVLAADISAHLNPLLSAGLYFDLAFIDPPYGRRAVRPAVANAVGSGTLNKGAIIIIEHDKHEDIPADMEGLEIIDRRKYGKTLVTFMKWM